MGEYLSRAASSSFFLVAGSSKHIVPYTNSAPLKYTSTWNFA
jgi:hypothetical protein